MGFCTGKIANMSHDKKESVLAATTEKSVEERLVSLESRVYVLEKAAGLIKTKTGKTKDSFVQLSSGTVNAVDWTRLPGSEFTFDRGLYGNNVEVTWQGWIDNGKGSVRLVDDTNHRVVDFSEVSVSGGSKSSFYSKPMAIWRGQNTYHIELKNIYGDITLSSPRLKISTY